MNVEELMKALAGYSPNSKVYAVCYDVDGMGKYEFDTDSVYPCNNFDDIAIEIKMPKEEN